MNHSFPASCVSISHPLQPTAILQFRTSQSLYPQAEAFAEKAVIGMTQEALSSLQTLGAQLRAKLLELPEYRALTVIERTIQELTEIMNPLGAGASDRVERQATPAETSNELSAAPQRVETRSSVAGSSQSRMAKAIADAIAAKAASFNASAAGAAHLGQTLNAAS
jgi:hypothetical protein